MQSVVRVGSGRETLAHGSVSSAPSGTVLQPDTRTDDPPSTRNDAGGKEGAGTKKDAGRKPSGSKPTAGKPGSDQEASGNVCESKNISARARPPDILIVLVDAVKALAEASIPTYVVGYDLSGPGADLDQLAKVGGTDHWYDVGNEAELDTAFEQITADIVKCEFELGELPPDPSYVRIEIDGELKVLDAADGWVIDGRKITL